MCSGRPYSQGFGGNFDPENPGHPLRNLFPDPVSGLTFGQALVDFLVNKQLAGLLAG
jgi:hypothetical protein